MRRKQHDSAERRVCRLRPPPAFANKALSAHVHLARGHVRTAAANLSGGCHARVARKALKSHPLDLYRKGLLTPRARASPRSRESTSFTSAKRRPGWRGEWDRLGGGAGHTPGDSGSCGGLSAPGGGAGLRVRGLREEGAGQGGEGTVEAKMKDRQTRPGASELPVGGSGGRGLEPNGRNRHAAPGSPAPPRGLCPASRLFVCVDVGQLLLRDGAPGPSPLGHVPLGPPALSASALPADGAGSWRVGVRRQYRTP